MGLYKAITLMVVVELILMGCYAFYVRGEPLPFKPYAPFFEDQSKREEFNRVMQASCLELVRIKRVIHPTLDESVLRLYFETCLIDGGVTL